MTVNGRGIRDTARVFKISKNRLISMLKKEGGLVQENPNFQVPDAEKGLEVRLEWVCDEEELGGQEIIL